MKLGGWQRLWILLSVIWLAPVAFFTVLFMPKAVEYEWQKSWATLDLIRKEASLRVQMPDRVIISNAPKGVTKEDLRELYAKHPKEKPIHTPLPKGAVPVLPFPKLMGLNPELRDLLKNPFAKLPEEQMRQLHEKYGKWIDFSEVENTYKDNLRQLRWEKAKIGMYGVLAWLTSISLLYLLGAAIGWIVRGFKTK